MTIGRNKQQEGMMNLPPGVAVADSTVVLDGVNANLLSLVAQLGMLHRLAFGEDLVIVAGMQCESYCKAGHVMGRAVDFRTDKLDNAGVNLLTHFLTYAADVQPISFMHTQYAPGVRHIHLEWHGA